MTLTELTRKLDDLESYETVNFQIEIATMYQGYDGIDKITVDKNDKKIIIWAY